MPAREFGLLPEGEGELGCLETAGPESLARQQLPHPREEVGKGLPSGGQIGRAHV